jgi:hypothetical protein
VPEVPTGDNHTKVLVYGAGAPLTGRTHYHISPNLAKEEFAKFLLQLVAYYPGNRLLVIQYLAGVKDQVRRLCGFKIPNSLVASL